MATYSVRAQIRAYLEANWTRCPLVFENELEPVLDPPAPWLHVAIYGRGGHQMSIGSGSPPAERWQEDGWILAHVHVPIGTGADLASQLAESLYNLLRGVVLPDGVRFGSMSVGAGDPGEDSGNWWRMMIRADWEKG